MSDRDAGRFRGAGPQFFYPDTPDLPVPPGHRFPVSKYRLLRAKMVAEGTLGAAALEPATSISRGDLERAHDGAFIDAALMGTLSAAAQRQIGLPWSPTLAARAQATCGGSLAAARAALRDGISGQLAGGTHHAHRAFGSGFCLFNDLAVTALALLADGAASRIAILDLDVHQGDGNAAILAGNPAVFVCSIHGAKNFPFSKVRSSLDLPLPDGTEGPAYMQALGQALEAVFGFRPDLVLYLSGADPLAADRLGRLALTPADMSRRDEAVFATFARAGVPVSIAIGGGYADPIALSIDAYAETFAAARRVHRF